LLNASLVQIAIEDPTSQEARWCFEQYFAELAERFEAGFDPSPSLPADAAELKSPSGVLLLARMRGQAVGCGALKLHSDAPAELKRMWVSRDARGLGVGRRLLIELEGHARAAGATVVHLETNRTLTEAISLYRSSGYLEVVAFNDEPYADHWFEKVLLPVPATS
jgi:ribosomal protein S18 acetylase RimI-like enzyme